MASLNMKILSLSEKYKTISEVESATKPSKVAEKYGIPRYKISTRLLPGKEEKLKMLFNLVRLAQKGKA